MKPLNRFLLIGFLTFLIVFPVVWVLTLTGLVIAFLIGLGKNNVGYLVLPFTWAGVPVSVIMAYEIVKWVGIWRKRRIEKLVFGKYDK